MNKRKIMIMMAGMVLPILAPQASAAAEHHDWEDQHVLSINREPQDGLHSCLIRQKGR